MPDLTPMTREEKFLNGDTDLTPITRREHFYAGTESELPEPDPITREEWFIQKYRGGGGGDITVESLSVTENGTYTAPSGKAYSPVEVDVPLPQNAYLLKSVANLPQAIASFSDGADAPMKSLKVAIEPQQDLHGYDSPWVGGAGKNKLLNTATTQTVNGITFTVNNDGSVNVNGTASANTTLLIARISDTNLTVGTEYILNGCPDSNSNYYISISDDLTATYTDYGSGATFTLNNDFVTNNAKIRIFIASGASVLNKVFKPMIRLSTESNTFAPYSNICPIIGWDEANVTVADDVETPTVSNVYTIDLNGTRYGGKLDVVNGIVTPAPYYASYNGETLTGEWISDRDKYEVGATPTIGAQVVNIGASGTPVSILPTAVKSLLGQNNIWADTGDITDAEYFSKEV